MENFKNTIDEFFNNKLTQVGIIGLAFNFVMNRILPYVPQAITPIWQIIFIIFIRFSKGY